MQALVKLLRLLVEFLLQKQTRCTCSNARACNAIDTYERLVIRGSSCTSVNLVFYNRK